MYRHTLYNAAVTHIKAKKVDNEIKQIFKRAPKDYPENIKRLLKQAIINLDYYVDSDEYSQYCFPALRALEGHIKYVITRSGGKIAHNFSTFQKDPETGLYVFTEEIKNKREKPHIEECYNYYKSVRDTIFHFGDIIGNSDTTRMMESKEDADEIIGHCIDLITWK